MKRKWSQGVYSLMFFSPMTHVTSILDISVHIPVILISSTAPLNLSSMKYQGPITNFSPQKIPSYLAINLKSFKVSSL